MTVTKAVSPGAIRPGKAETANFALSLDVTAVKLLPPVFVTAKSRLLEPPIKVGAKTTSSVESEAIG